MPANTSKAARVKMVIEVCAKVGITKKDICKKFDLVKAEDLQNGDLKELSKLARQISSGEKKLRELFKK